MSAVTVECYKAIHNRNEEKAKGEGKSTKEREKNPKRKAIERVKNKERKE